MYCRISLVFTLLCCCAGEFSVRPPSQQVLAYAGEDVILPCTLKDITNGDIPTVEWSKEGLKTNVVFLYRDGCETHEMKHPDFEYRTSLILKELKNGNVSLRISNVQLPDAGIYQCMQLWKNAPRDITTVELVVDSVSEPRLSVVSSETESVTLECEVTYSQTEPQIKFLDDWGNSIPAEDPKIEEEANGFHTVRRRMTLRTAAKRITCRVEAGINLVKAADILIPDDYMKSCLLTAAISAVAILVLGILCGLIVCFWKTCCKSAQKEKPPEPRQELNQSTQSLLEQGIIVYRTDNGLNSTIERLEREAVDLKSQLDARDETIRQLQKRLKSQQSSVQPVLGSSTSSQVDPSFSDGPVTNHFTKDDTQKPFVLSINSPQSTVSAQNRGSNSGIQWQNGNSIQELPTQRKLRNHSCPAFMSSDVAVSSSASISKEKPQNCEHSASEYYEHSQSRPQRAHSLMLPSSNLSSKDYTTLRQVREES